MRVGDPLAGDLKACASARRRCKQMDEMRTTATTSPSRCLGAMSAAQKGNKPKERKSG